MTTSKSLMRRSGLDEALVDFQYLEVNPGDLELPPLPEYARGGSCSLQIGTYTGASHFGRGQPIRTHVAVKIFKMGATEEDRVKMARRFVKELKVWSTLDHESVLPLTAYYVTRDLYEAWLVSELQCNGNILEYTRLRGREQDLCLKVLGDVLLGLEYLHSKEPPVIHRDIKPGNVLIGSGEPVLAMLCDFGLCKEISEEATSSNSTTSPQAPEFGGILPNLETLDHIFTNQSSEYLQGTCRYVSPELLHENPPPYSTASDM